MAPVSLSRSPVVRPRVFRDFLSCYFSFVLSTQPQWPAGGRSRASRSGLGALRVLPLCPQPAPRPCVLQVRAQMPPQRGSAPGFSSPLSSSFLCLYFFSS